MPPGLAAPPAGHHVGLARRNGRAGAYKPRMTGRNGGTTMTFTANIAGVAALALTAMVIGAAARVAASLAWLRPQPRGAAAAPGAAGPAPAPCRSLPPALWSL
jgi:hypothetical protein